MSEKSENEPDLGKPDFGSFMDDDNVEIDDHHVKGEKTQPDNSLLIGEVGAMTTGMIFSFVASRKGEHWRLTPDEGEQIADVSQQCMDEYMPDFEMSPVWLLAGITTGIVAPRLLLDIKVQAQKDKEAEHRQKEAAQNAGHETPESQII